VNRSNTVVVLTPLDLEYVAMRAHMAEVRIERYEGTVAEVGRLVGSSWFVALLTSGEGNVDSGLAAMGAMRHFNPRALLIIGIAGSVKDGVEIGDVVVATRVYGYHGGKEDTDGFHARPRAWEPGHALLQEARLVGRQSTWRAELPDIATHFKPIAAGEVVLNSRTAALHEQLRHHYNDAVAIEMESAGVAAASHLHESMPFLTIRGISDKADGNKHLSDGRGLQPMAASHAATFAAALIRSMPKPRPPNVDEPGSIGEKVLEAKLTGPVNSLCFGPDRSVLAAADKGPVRRWRLDDGGELPAMSARAWPGPRYGVRVAASQEWGAIVLRDGFSLHAVDADAPGADGTPMGGITYPGYLDAASSGRYAITSWGTRFTLRSTSTGQTVRTFSAVTTSMSADSRLLAVAYGMVGGGRTVRVHRLVPGHEDDEREHRTIELHQAAGRALQIALSPDGTLLGCVTARWAGIYDVESCEPVKPRSGDDNMLTQTFPDAMGLLCTPAGHLLWMSRGRVLQMRGNRRDDLPTLPDRSGYRRIAISVDGAFLATGDDAGWLRVWRWRE
jgi:5'-methylthioadenosine/S-adenosylhomocysteine nucleosidase